MAIRKNTPRSQETSPKLTFTVDLFCTPSEGVGALTIATGTKEPFSPKIYHALLPKESRFPGISTLLQKE